MCKVAKYIKHCDNESGFSDTKEPQKYSNNKTEDKALLYSEYFLMRVISLINISV